MKKKFGKFFIILLTALSLGVSACGANNNQPSGPTEAEVALQEAKSAAISQVDAWDLSVYREAEKTTLQLAIATFKAEVNDATTEDEVSAALNKLIGVKNTLKTAAQYEEEEAAAAAAALASAKSTAKSALESYAVATDYDEDNWARVQAAINSGKEAIDAASSIAAVDEALANAKSAIDAIAKKPTADELALQNAKNSAKTEVNGWNVNLYRETEKATLEAAIAVFNREVAAAVTVSEVTNALNKVKAVKAGLKTAAEYEREEAAAALAKAKSDAKTEIEGYADQEEYTETNWQKLQGIVTAGKAAIEAATTVEAVATALSNAKSAIDAVEKKPQTPIEQILLEAIEGLNNYTTTITYKENYMTMTSVCKFTGVRYSAHATGVGDIEYSYAELVEQMHVADWAAAKSIFEQYITQQEQMSGGTYHYTAEYNDANQKVNVHMEMASPFSTYVDYDESAKQYYFYAYGKGIVEEFQYLLDSEAAAVEDGYFIGNAPLFATLISAENYDPETESYRLTDEKALYLIGGDAMAQLRAKNFGIKFVNNMPKEFTFSGYNGFSGGFVDYKVEFSDFGTTKVETPQITKPICDHKYCSIEHDIYEGRGHRDYCSRCRKYVGELEEHNFDNTYKVCTECLYVNSNEEYVNPNYISVDGVPFVKFVKSVDGKNFVTGEFSTQVGDSAGIIYGQGYAMQYIVEKATNKLALVTYGVGELLEGKTCEYAQANELKLYVFDFDANIELFRTKWSDNQIFAQRYVENPETGEWGYVTDSSTLNYEFLITQILAGGLNPDLKQFAFFEANAAKVCEEVVYSTYHRHDDQYKIDLSDPCDRIEYHQCRNCNEYTSIPTHYDNHAWGEEYSLIATPSGFEGAVFFERECENCHKKQTLYIPANQMSQAQYHTQNSTSCIIYQPGSSATTYTSLQLGHLYNGNHQCVLCGQKEITSISVGEGVIKNEYEVNNTEIGISEITVNYYDGSQKVVPLRDPQTNELNFDIEISKDKASETITHENQTLNDGDLVGEAKLTITYQGVKLEKDITVIPHQASLENFTTCSTEYFSCAGEPFKIAFFAIGKINTAELSFTDQNEDPVEVEANNERIDYSQETNTSRYYAELETDYVGTLMVHIGAEGPHDSSSEMTVPVPVIDLVSVTPVEDLVVNHIRGRDDLDSAGNIANYSYKETADGEPQNDSLPFSLFYLSEEADELPDGENKVTIDVFGQEVEVTINVKTPVSIDAILEGPNANKTEYAFEDGGIFIPINAIVTYSDDSTEEVFVYNAYIINPNEQHKPGETPMTHGINWNVSGTWIVHYSYGGVENSYEITVADRIPVEITDMHINGIDIMLLDSSYSFDIYKDPYNGDIIDIEWINNTPEVLEIEQDGEQCHVSGIAIGQGSVTVRVTTINDQVLEDTFDVYVSTTLFPTFSINDFLGDGFDIPAFNCRENLSGEDRIIYYYFTGYFTDLFGEMDELGWTITINETNHVFEAVSPDGSITIFGDYYKEPGQEQYHDLEIYDSVVRSNFNDVRDLEQFTFLYLLPTGYISEEPIWYLDDTGTNILNTRYVHMPDIEFDDLDSESVQQLLETLKDGMLIDGYTNLVKDADSSDGNIGYTATYHNLTIRINISIDENNSDQLFIQYIYSYPLPNPRVNP